MNTVRSSGGTHPNAIEMGAAWMISFFERHNQAAPPDERSLFTSSHETRLLAMTRYLRLVLLAIGAVSLPSRPLKGQPVHRHVESVETMVDRATRVVVARVAQVSLTPDNRGRIPTELTVDEVLKGDGARPLSVGLPYHESQLARWRETRAPLLVSIPLDTSAYPVVVDLADSTLAMMTADFVVLRDSGQVMRAVREAIGRPPPEADRVSCFALTVPPEAVVGTPLAQWRLWLSLSVPIDARLESRALAILRGEQPFRGVRVEAVNALRHFKSDSNVRVLTALLADTATGLQQRVEDNMGREIRVYLVRQAAYAILTSWGLAPPEPVMRIETYRPELAEVVDLATKAIAVASEQSLTELASAGAPYVAPPTDCATTVRALDERLFVIRFRAWSTADRRECLGILARMLADSTDTILAEAAARGIEKVALSRLIDDDVVLDPLIDCIRRNLAQIGQYCNRALATLTRHGYGVDVFSGDAGTPPLTDENLSRVVADWTAYRNLQTLSRPIFDGYLEDESLRAVREVSDSLQAVFRRSLPAHHPVSSYIEAASASASTAIRRVHPDGSVIYSAVGELAANWPNRDPLRTVRFILARPGLPQPSSGVPTTGDLKELPVDAADYREAFPGLDLEFRFQILTADSALRAAAVTGVRQALSSLREAEALSRQAASLRLSLDDIRSHCAAFERNPDTWTAFKDCRISEVRAIGAIDGETYYAAIYCLLAEYARPEQGMRCGGGSFNARSNTSRGMAVLSRLAGAPAPTVVFGRLSPLPTGPDVIYERPTITPNEAGVVLTLPIRVDGTGNYNASEYYLREGGRWERLESETWLDSLTRRLPAGLEVWKGIWLDMRTLRAETGLWRPGDGNCCPTGGTARIQLAIRDRQFELVSVEVVR